MRMKDNNIDILEVNVHHTNIRTSNSQKIEMGTDLMGRWLTRQILPSAVFVFGSSFV